MTQEDLFQAKSTKEKSGYSQVDTHANPSRSREIAEEKKTLATSFRTSIELLNKQDPLIVFSKMFMGMSQWDLTRYSLKWKGSTTIRGNLLFRLQVSERDTKETDSGSSVKMWATPNTMDALPPRSAEATKKLQEGHRKGRKRPSNLREQVDKKTMALYETNYPTPTTKGFGHASEGMTLIFRKKVENGEMTEQEAQAMMNGVTLRPPRMKEWKYPTPNAGLVKHSYNGNHEYYKKRLKDGRQVDLAHKIFQEEGDGRLNANWTEWLMGYPIGWTNLEESQESQSIKKTDPKD